MTFDAIKDVQILLPELALAAIFDECDQFDRDETGGRLIGAFREHRGKLTIEVTGVIESGPQARRTSVSFFQDGAYQEEVFRRIEQDHPDIEHLGNWHTHHVNGFATLSGGDVSTYQRTVNHPNHNTSFFYALLVTARGHGGDLLRRYHVKHYIVRRDDARVYEIPSRYVKIVKRDLVWPKDPSRQIKNPAAEDDLGQRRDRFGVVPQRAYDRDILSEFYAGFKPYASKALGVYWRGLLELMDGSSIEVLLTEDATATTPVYSVLLKDAPGVLMNVAASLQQERFRSARAALVTAERTCNRALYHGRLSREVSSD